MNTSARRSSALRAGLVLLATVVWSPGLGAQERPTSAQDSLRMELRRLASLVDSLRAEVNRLQSEGKPEEAQDALAALRAAAQAAAASGGGEPPPTEAPATQEFVGRQRSLQALNPEISLTGDVFGQVIKGDPNKDNFFAREFELSVISNLDPFSRAKVFISRHDHGGEIMPFGEPEEEEEHGEGFAVEEGYVEWVSLPGGFGLKFGRFYQQLGQLNRWHSHAIPFQSRSLPSLTFIGEEPLAQTGVSVRWLLPVGGNAGTYTATFETTASSNEALYGVSTRPSLLANLNGFWQLSDATDLDLTATWTGGKYEDDTNLTSRNLYAGEMSFTWSPPAATRYRGVNVRAGVMILDGLISADGEPMDGTAKGVWTMAEAKLNQSWLVGGRVDWTQNPLDTDETAWLVSPTLTWWQSEYVRIRGEYDLLGRADFRDGRFLLQATFSMGPHKHETY